MVRRYLRLLILLTLIILGVEYFFQKLKNRINTLQEISDKYYTLFLMLNQWLAIKQEGKNLYSYFEKYGYRRIAIYGMSYVGKSLFNELKGKPIEVVYGIDKNFDKNDGELRILNPNDNLEDVDVIIVTPITFFNEIEEILSVKINCPVISLGDVLYEM